MDHSSKKRGTWSQRIQTPVQLYTTDDLLEQKTISGSGAIMSSREHGRIDLSKLDEECDRIQKDEIATKDSTIDEKPKQIGEQVKGRDSEESGQKTERSEESESPLGSPKTHDERMPKLLIGSTDAQEAPVKSPKYRRTRNSLFAEQETINDEREIFAIDGSKSIKLPRRRDLVSVFPTGTMGIAEEKDNLTPRRFLTPIEIQERDAGHIDSTPHKRPPSARPAVVRNPLTGEGYSDHDFVPSSTFRRKDGNPVLGSGYKTTDPKQSKVPPGGYSKGLW